MHLPKIFLGLHLGNLIDDKVLVERLGGYQLENVIIPHSRSALLVGAFNSGKFRGEIGPIAIFSMPDLSESFDKILAALVASPREVPADR